MEMSTLDIRLPKYYKSFDMDILTKKVRNDESLTEEEDRIYDEALDVFIQDTLKKNEKNGTHGKKEHPGEYRIHTHHRIKPMNYK